MDRKTPGYLQNGLGATTDMAIGTIKPAVINHDLI